MSAIVTVKGIDRLMSRLNTAFVKNRNRANANLLRAALLIQGEAQQRCPVDTGNLKNSAQTVWSKGDDLGPIPEVTMAKVAAEQSAKMLAQIAANTKKSTRLKTAAQIAMAKTQPTHEENAAQVQAMVDSSPGFSVAITFTAAYAIYVHENMQAHHASGQAKFLEAAVRENLRVLMVLMRAPGP